MIDSDLCIIEQNNISITSLKARINTWHTTDEQVLFSLSIESNSNSNSLTKNGISANDMIKSLLSTLQSSRSTLNSLHLNINYISMKSIERLFPLQGELNGIQGGFPSFTTLKIESMHNEFKSQEDQEGFLRLLCVFQNTHPRNLIIDFTGNSFNSEQLSIILRGISETFNNLASLSINISNSTIKSIINKELIESSKSNVATFIQNSINLESLSLNFRSNTSCSFIMLGFPTSSLSQNVKLQTLELDVTDTMYSFVQIKKVLFAFPNLRQLKLIAIRNQFINFQSFLDDLLTNNLSLETFSLYFTYSIIGRYLIGLHDITLAQIMTSFSKFPFLKQLELRIKNNIYSDQMKVDDAFDHLFQFPYLEHLAISINENKISESSLISLASGIKTSIPHPKLRVVKLDFSEEKHQGVTQSTQNALEQALISLPFLVYGEVKCSTPDLEQKASPILQLLMREYFRQVCEILVFKQQLSNYMLYFPTMILWDLLDL